jgi:thiol-disulfide isomerase/thioredoxin
MVLQKLQELVNKAKSVFNKNTVSAMAGGAIKPGTSNMMTTFTYVIFAVILIIIGYSIYIYYIKPSLKKNNMNTAEVYNESSTENTNQAELMLFYVDWCPHCKTAKPAWEEIKAQYENKTINGYKVIFTEINCTEETAEVDKMMNKYNVEGYPTIKLLKDGQVIEYDAKPSKETLTQFLNTVL